MAPFEIVAGERILPLENGFYACAALLALLLIRVLIYYHFQTRAIELAAPEIRSAVCGHLYGGKKYRSVLRLSLRADLQQIFNLAKWRFHDFYPGFTERAETG